MVKKLKKGFSLWFTGLSGSGKSAIADNLYSFLEEKGYTNMERLDGDIIRQDLTKDLGFTKKDRKTNIERVTFVIKLLSRNGIGVIASFISPYEQERNFVKNNVTNYIEVFIETSLEVCEKRDVKGFYKKAREGKIKNFTGISDPYEIPKKPDIHIETKYNNINSSVEKIYNYLYKNGYLI